MHKQKEQILNKETIDYILKMEYTPEILALKVKKEMLTLELEILEIIDQYLVKKDLERDEQGVWL